VEVFLALLGYSPLRLQLGARLPPLQDSAQTLNDTHRSLDFESLETIFWVKILQFFDADANPDKEIRVPGWEKFEIRDKHPGLATLEKS
jgi:hypothetical protein